MKRFNLFFSALLCLTLASDLSKAQSFVDVAVQAGINGSTGDYSFGSGISLVDFDFDGLDDITLGTEWGDSILFFKNLGDGSFSKIGGLLPDTTLNGSIIWVDIDNDYDLDIFVCNRPFQNHPSGQNRLYENIGNFEFVDITNNSGLNLVNDDSYGASFGDYNNDGYLDLFVSNRLTKCYFYKNNGDRTFTDITSTVGIEHEDQLGFDLAFCAAFFDFDNDGDLDLYSVSDKIFVKNRLYVNDGNGHYDEMATNFGVDGWMDGMSASISDADNDGWSDIYVTNTEPGAKFFLNSLGNYFFLQSSSIGISLTNCTSWGAVWGDVDNDKDQDLYVCTTMTPLQDSNRNFLFKNVGEPGYPQFELYDTVRIQGDTLTSFSASLFDYNNDGKIDFVVNNGNNDPIQLLQNQISNDNYYIKFSLRGDTSIYGSNSFGVGSRIEIYDGDSLQTRYTHCGINFLGQNPMVEHVGMGQNLMVDSLIVYWPSGTIDRHYNLGVNENYQFFEGKCLDHVYSNFTSFNNYIGTNGDLTDLNNWSLGHLPAITENILIEANGDSLLLINDDALMMKSMILKEGVTLINNGLIEIHSSSGTSIRIENGSHMINHGDVQIYQPCGDGLLLEGSFTNNAEIHILQE